MKNKIIICLFVVWGVVLGISPAEAQLANRILLSASKAATITFGDSGYDTSSPNPKTFTGLNFNTAAANRKIVALVSGQGGSSTLISVSIGGVSATYLTRATNGSATVEGWIASVPTGTSGDVVIQWTAGQSQEGVAIWSVYGASSSVYDTGTSTADPLTHTLNIAPGGVAIGYAVGFSASPTFTWTNLTEDVDEVWAPTDIGSSGASDAFAGAQSALAITGAQSTTTTTPILLLLSFSPG